MEHQRALSIDEAARNFREALLRQNLGKMVLVGTELHLPGQMVQDRDDQVQNNAGGYVFPVSDETRIRRFLILGCAGGSYYATEKEMTLESAAAMKDIIEQGKGDILLREIREISLAGRNPKQEPLLFSLALCARYKVTNFNQARKHQIDPDDASIDYYQALQRTAMSIVNDVCRIPTHLFAFVDYCEMIAGKSNKVPTTGWGRAMRSVICNWYNTKKPDQLAIHLTKYKQRNGWSHRDLFRLAHPRRKQNIYSTIGGSLEVEQLYHYAVKGKLMTRKRKLTDEQMVTERVEHKYSDEDMDKELASPILDMVETFLGLSKATPEADVIKAIKEHKLVREHIPTEHLSSVGVWQALLDHMPMTAMIRNLGKLSSIDALDEHYTQLVVDQLTNEENLKKAKVHPITILLAKSIYQQGGGDRGSLKWTVNPRVNQALEDGFYKSFINASPTGKRFCFAYDISGSMCAPVLNGKLSCRTASAALSLVSLRTEENYACVAFCSELVTVPYDGTWDIKRIEEHMDSMTFGSTDCSLPMIWAKNNDKKFDVFVIFTDSETWAGEVKPFDALRQYRESSGIHDAKLIVLGMTCTNFTIADPTDAGMLDIAGFDSAVPTLISEFVAGTL